MWFFLGYCMAVLATPDTYLYLLKKFLFWKYSKAVLFMFYVKYTWKDVVNTLGCIVLGADTV